MAHTYIREGRVSNMVKDLLVGWRRAFNDRGSLHSFKRVPGG